MKIQRVRPPNLRRASLLCVLVLAASFVVGGWLRPEAAVAVPDQTIRTIQFNVCGSVCYLGSSTAAVDTANSINSYNPHMVTLVEVCWSHVTDISARTSMHNLYFETSGPYSRDGRGQNSCANDRFGISSFSDRAYVNGTRAYKYLSYPSSNEWRGVDCKNTVFLHTVALCVTHIDPTWPNTQIGEVRTFVDPIVRGSTGSYGTLMGGDFNVTPRHGALNTIYSSDLPGGYGSLLGGGTILEWIDARSYRSGNPQLRKN